MIVPDIINANLFLGRIIREEDAVHRSLRPNLVTTAIRLLPL